MSDGIIQLVHCIGFTNTGHNSRLFLPHRKIIQGRLQDSEASAGTYVPHTPYTCWASGFVSYYFSVCSTCVICSYYMPSMAYGITCTNLTALHSWGQLSSKLIIWCVQISEFVQVAEFIVPTPHLCQWQNIFLKSIPYGRLQKLLIKFRIRSWWHSMLNEIVPAQVCTRWCLVQ